MNRNVVIVLAGGFVVALLVAIVVQTTLGKRGGGSAGGDSIEVLVASHDLKTGAELTGSDVRWQRWPGSAFTGAIKRENNQEAKDAIKGRLGRPVASGEPLLRSALIAEKKGNFLAAALKPGMRAVAIDVKAADMVGGFIAPGDFVDVIVTYEVKLKGAAAAQSTVNKLASETVLENVRVMAVDQESKREEEKAKVGKTVTLEVDVAGAEKLNLADAMGDLALALRGVGDDTLRAQVIPPTTDVTASRLMTGLKAPDNTGAGGAGKIVRIYTGANVQNMTVRSESSSSR